MDGIPGRVRTAIMASVMVIVSVLMHRMNVFPVTGTWMGFPVGIGDRAMSDTALPIPRARVNPCRIGRTPSCILVRTLRKSAWCEQG